jgi:hypothetical protein
MDHPELDTLDVLCFGRESFERIAEQAMQQFGRGADGPAAVTLAEPKDDTGEVGPTKAITIAPRVGVEFEIPNVRRLPPSRCSISKLPKRLQCKSCQVSVSLDRVAAEDELLRYNAATVVRNAALRVIAQLPYLSPVVHHAPWKSLSETSSSA